MSNGNFIPLSSINFISENEYDPRFRSVGALIVKITHRCNLDCSYCYEYITKGNDMSLDTFKILVIRTLRSTEQDDVLFIFHGGEPTLVESDWFIKAVEFARQKARETRKRIRFAIQSNALALDDSKIELLRDLNIRLSISIDGPPFLPNMMRKRAEIAIKNYQRAVSAGLKPGILMTINHSNFNYFHQICRWLEKELQVHDFKANVISSVGRGINLPDLEHWQIFQAYRDILEYMIATKGCLVIEDNLSLELIRFFAKSTDLVKLPNELCRTRRCGAGQKVLGITPDGKILPCGRFQWNEKEYFLGDLNENQFDLDVFQQAINDFHTYASDNWNECSKCEARNICSYGCQAFIVRSKSKINLECLPTKMKYSYFETNRERLLPVVESIKRRIGYFMTKNEILAYRDKYNDGGPYNDTYNDEKGSYSDIYSDIKYNDFAYSDVRNYNDYQDIYNDYKDSSIF